MNISDKYEGTIFYQILLIHNIADCDVSKKKVPVLKIIRW